MLYAVFTNISEAVSPILMGFIIAFVINVPIKQISRQLLRLFDKVKIKPKESIITIISLLLTLLLGILLVVAAGAYVVPNIIESFKGVVIELKSKLPVWIEAIQSDPYLGSLIPIESLDSLDEIDVPAILKKIDEMGIVNSIGSLSGTVISSFANVGMALVIAIYAILDKKRLCKASKRLVYAVFKKEIAERLCHIADLVNKTYSKFFTGQLTEACILGCLMLTSLSVFRLPHAGITAFLTAICAFVPYVGAFLACAVGALMVALVAPGRIFIYLIVYLVTQFIENQFIYPRVVGSSVGLPAMFTLIAVIIGSKLFGIIGMIFAIPIMAVIYALLGEFIDRRLKERKIDI